MGRPAQAPALKLLKGRSPGRDSGGRKVEPPPPFVRRAPDPPAGMSREAKAEWARVVPELERLGLLKSASLSSLVAHCETWATFVAATKQVRKQGLTLESGGGMVRANPAVGIAQSASKDIRAWCGEFGLTPASEGKLKVPERPSDEGGDFD